MDERETWPNYSRQKPGTGRKSTTLFQYSSVQLGAQIRKQNHTHPVYFDNPVGVLENELGQKIQSELRLEPASLRLPVDPFRRQATLLTSVSPVDYLQLILIIFMIVYQITHIYTY